MKLAGNLKKLTDEELDKVAGGQQADPSPDGNAQDDGDGFVVGFDSIPSMTASQFGASI